MNMLVALFLLPWLSVNDLTIVAPTYPPLALHGGNVVAFIEPSNHSDNRIVILHPEPPFVDDVQIALKQWRLPTTEGRLVIINFRDWGINHIWTDNVGIKFIPHRQKIQWTKADRSKPLPTLIVDPLYPDVYPKNVYVVPGGAVILHLVIDPRGHVSRIDKIQGILNEFDQAATEAVGQWLFLPAQNENGKVIESDAYAICVYRPLTRNQAYD